GEPEPGGGVHQAGPDTEDRRPGQPAEAHRDSARQGRCGLVHAAQYAPRPNPARGRVWGLRPGRSGVSVVPTSSSYTGVLLPQLVVRSPQQIHRPSTGLPTGPSTTSPPMPGSAVMSTR